MKFYYVLKFLSAIVLLINAVQAGVAPICVLKGWITIDGLQNDDVITVEL